MAAGWARLTLGAPGIQTDTFLKESDAPEPRSAKRPKKQVLIKGNITLNTI